MKPFGNIICNINGQPDTFLNLKRYATLKEVEDKSIPTIIIGWEKAKKNISGINILQKWYPEQNVGWTFSKTERGADYQKDIVTFCEWVLNNVISKSTYKYVDVINMTFEETKKFIRFIKSDIPKFVFSDRGKFLFVHSRKHNRTYGLSLTTCSYIGIDKNKIINRILDNPYNNRVENFSAIPYTLRSKLGDKLHLYFSLLEYFV